MRNKILPKVIIILIFSIAITCFTRNINSESSSNVVITKLSEFSTHGRAFDVKVVDDIAFVADLNTGLNIINISDPNSPTLTSLYSMENAHKVIIDENIAYVTNWNYGFEIINITDLENPEQLSRFSGIAFNTFDIENDCAFIDSEGLLILNISDPKNPKEIHHYYACGNTSAVYVEENLVYLGTYIYGSFYGFTIVDVTDKMDPQILGHYNTTDIVAGIRVSGDVALAANWEDGLLIFNVSNPENPVVLSSYYDGGGSEIAYFVDGYAFVADYDNGLEILDINDPENPFEVGQFFDGGGAYGIAFQNNLAFIADDSDGLEILEITGLLLITPTETTTEETSFSILLILPIGLLIVLVKKEK